MKIHGSLALKLCLCVVASAAMAGATTQPTLSASPGAVEFQYSPPEPTPLPQFVAVTASNGTTPIISVVVAAATGTPAALFPKPQVNGDKIQVYFDIATFTELASQPGIYTATYTVSASGFKALTIPVTLSIGAPLSIIPSVTSLAFYVPGVASQTIALAGTSSTSLGFSLSTSVSGGGAWLIATTNQSYTPAVLTVAVATLNVPAGSYTGTVTVTPTSGAPLVIPITLQLGPDTLTASAMSFAFAYNVGGTTPPAQVLQLSSPVQNDSFVAQASSTGDWLMVNGVTTNVSGPLPASLNVTVNPAGLASGSYQGTITATDAENGTQLVTVTLVVSTVSNVANPDSLVFVAQAGGTAPAAQPVYINGFGAASYTIQITGDWISVSAISGSAPTQVTVSVNPTGLVAGTYVGSLVVNLNTHIQRITVTLIVSANPVLTTDLGGFIFNYVGGNLPPPAFTLNVGVSNGGGQAFIYAPGVPSWLGISSTSNNLSAPQPLTITLSPQTLPTGTYLAQIILVPTAAGGIPIVVPVFLVVINAPPAVPNPASLSFSAMAGDGPQSQTVAVTASTPTAFTATANGGEWLSVSPLSATANLSTPITVIADATSLAAGNYQGTVTLTTAGGVLSEIAVAFTVAPSTAPFSVTPTALSFAYIQNGALPPAQTVQVTGSQPFTATAASTGGAWLAVTPAAGTQNASLSVTANPAGLAPGTYNGSITVAPATGTAQIVAVTLTVATQGSLTASANTLSFAYVSGGTPPAAQSLSITSSGSAVAFTAAAISSGWLSVTPTSAATPAALSVSVNAANLGGGSYSGTIALSDTSGTLQLTVSVTLTVAVQLPAITRVVNAASYLEGGIAPGEIVTIFGSALGPTAGVGATIDSKGFIETSLASVQVTFNGYPAPILYASAGQVNAIAPYEIAGASTVSVEALFGTARSNPLSYAVEPSSPGIFSADASGQGPGAILDVNYRLVSASNPVSPGAIIQVFATGQGQTSPAGVDGLIEPLSLPLPGLLLGSTATIGGLPATIDYIGAAPGLVAGALQINIFVPEAVAPGAAPLFLFIGNQSSQTGITVAVQ